MPDCHAPPFVYLFTASNCKYITYVMYIITMYLYIVVLSSVYILCTL